MNRIWIVLVGSGVLVGALTGATQEKLGKDTATIKVAAEPYEGFKVDQALLRKQFIRKARDTSKDTAASSGEACEAAKRIFSRVSFLFRTREEVLDLLGDPATISDYGRPAGNDPSSPLEYLFDTGYDGVRFTLSFSKLSPTVDQVRVEYLD